MSAPRTRRVAVAVAAALVIVAVAALLVRQPAPRTLDQRSRDVTSQLRCPTCEGQTVADSTTPLARSMQRQVRTQLAAGRTSEQVLGWFEQRYGEDVLLVPGRRGTDVLLWLAPGATLAGGLALLLLQRRRRTGARSDATSGGAAAPGAVPLSRGRLAVAGTALVALGAGVPLLVAGAAAEDTAPVASDDVDADSWASAARELDERGDYATAVRLWRRALSLEPESTAIRTSLAFDLVRTGRPAAAERMVSAIARQPGEHRAFALLVLGLAQRDQGEPAADRTLRAFVRLEPRHPAAAAVRRMLERR